LKFITFLSVVLSHSVLANSGLVKMDSSFRHQLTPDCKKEVLNPHLGGDIFYVECSENLDVSLEVNQTWQLATTNDPESSDQWALEAQNIFKWWEAGRVGSTEVTVAIIDSGVNVDHEDFDPSLFVNTKEINNNGIDDDQNGYIDDYYGWNAVDSNTALYDPYNHGNGIAGVIGAKSNNSIGIAGLNWKVKIVPVKFIGGNGGGTTDIAIKSIDYAVSRGAKIINLSWGGYNDSPLLKEVMERCRKLGVLFIAASGNEKNDNDIKPFYPASFELDNIISVGSISFHKALSDFSNFGKKTVHVLAPGESILTTVSTARYGYQKGTSFAAPQITGVAALIWAQYPDWSYQEVKNFIMQKCVQSDDLKEKVLCGGYFSF